MWFFKEKIDTSLVMKFGFLGGIAEALYCSSGFADYVFR